MRFRTAVVGLTLLASLLCAKTTAATAAVAASGAAAPRCGRSVVAHPVHTESAVTALGTALPEVAAANGTTARELAADLRDDPTLWLDRCGAAFYVDPEPARTATDARGDGAAAALFPYDQTFALHSDPGSQHVLYLDFDGQHVAGTAWNDSENGGRPIDAPPFDTDGRPTAFSTAEQDVVQSVWQRVSEDYAPFDVDVTTEDPGESAIGRSGPDDPTYGSRVVVTDSMGPSGADCGCGGIAYVDVFDRPFDHGSFQPAWVFASQLGYGAKNIAEAAAHEAGHNLGLSHDGTSGQDYYAGQGLWAPIMGVGYTKPLSQWSRGEYGDANNAEDDLAVIAGHGAPNRPDDHGDSAATATPLDRTLTAAGVIGGPGDTDWFSFTSVGGQTTATVTPAPVSPDLDASVTVYSAAGAVVGSADPTSAAAGPDRATGLGAAFLRSPLPAGRYFVKVDGVGSGAASGTGYSDYGSLGRYTLAVTTAEPARPTITTQGLRPAVVSRTYQPQQLVASGGTTPWTWAATGLPAGLTLSSSGVLSGVPAAAGAATAVVTVTDADGSRASRELPLTVASAFRATPVSAAVAITGTPYTAALSATGGLPPYRWHVDVGVLPPGLSLSTDGVLSGTPARSGLARVVVGVTDSEGYVSRVTTTLAVADTPLRVTGPLVAHQLVAGTVVRASLTAAGGNPGYRWSLTDGALPPGLRVEPTGTMSGTPSTAGTYAYTVTVVDAAGTRESRQLSTTVVSPPGVVSAALPEGTTGRAYSARLSARSGLAPYRWSIGSGSLPSGLRLGSDGVVSGTPTRTERRNVLFAVQDGRGVIARRWLTVVVRTPVGVRPASLPGATRTGAYSVRATATGGTGRYTWSKTRGALPPGTSLGSSGTLSGRTTKAGRYAFTLTARDTVGRTASRSFTVVVARPPAITTRSLTVARLRRPYSADLARTGGTPGYRWAVTSGRLPSGLTLKASGALRGTPKARGRSTFTVTLTDARGVRSRHTFALRVR